MTDITNIINASLREVELQLLAEFSRINILSLKPIFDQNRDAKLNPKIQKTMLDNVEQLRRALERGNHKQLQLQSLQYEKLYTRASTIDKLLRSQVTTAFLHEIDFNIDPDKENMATLILSSLLKKITSAKLTSPTKQIDDTIELVLEATRDQQGRAVFEAKELSRPHLSDAKIEASKAEPRDEIAQSPEAIRKKLADHRQRDNSRGKAVFEAKDISKH